MNPSCECWGLAACLWESSRFWVWSSDPAGHSVLMKPQGALAFWRPLPSPPVVPAGKFLPAFILEVLFRRQQSPRLLPATRRAAGGCSLCARGSGEAELPGGGGGNWMPTLAEKSSWASLPAFSPPPPPTSKLPRRKGLLLPMLWLQPLYSACARGDWHVPVCRGGAGGGEVSCQASPHRFLLHGISRGLQGRGGVAGRDSLRLPPQCPKSSPKEFPCSWACPLPQLGFFPDL